MSESGIFQRRVPLGGLLAGLIVIHGLMTLVAVDFSHDLFGMSALIDHPEGFHSSAAGSKLLFIHVVLAPANAIIAEQWGNRLQIGDWGLLVLNTLGTSLFIWLAALVIRQAIARLFTRG
jgi:uncharacterized membrane protein